MGTHDFKYIKVPLFARKTGNINTSMFAAPKKALVPASRYYCAESSHTTMSVPNCTSDCGQWGPEYGQI